MWPKYSKYKQNQWNSAFVFDPLLGLILEVFWEPKWRPRPSKSHLKKTPTEMMPKMSPKGVNMESKSSNMKSWKHLVSRVAPKWPPDPLQDRFWRGFGTILEQFSFVFLTMFADFGTHSVAACYKQKRSKSWGITKRMQQRASKKQLLSSCHLALKHSLANVNELSGPC